MKIYIASKLNNAPMLLRWFDNVRDRLRELELVSRWLT